MNDQHTRDDGWINCGDSAEARAIAAQAARRPARDWLPAGGDVPDHMLVLDRKAAALGLTREAYIAARLAEGRKDLPPIATLTHRISTALTWVGLAVILGHPLVLGIAYAVLRVDASTLDRATMGVAGVIITAMFTLPLLVD